VEQLDPSGQTGPALPGWTADLDRRATEVLHRIAPSLGQPAAHLATGVMAISNMFTPVGVASTDRDARIPRLLMCLEEARADLARWIEADPGNDIGGLGQAIMIAMRRAGENAATVLERTRSALRDTPALLKRWIRDPDGVAALVARCDWLLDGWDQVRLLWLAARTTASRRAALLEMAPLVPVLPREVMDWTGIPIASEAMRQAFRVTSREDTWRTGGSAIALIERNEKLLAMAAWTGPPPVSFMDGCLAS
jgi:hypothetical protein